MKKWLILICLMSGTLLFVAHPAQAIPITLDFSVSGFGLGAPTDPVSGSIVFDAASATANIDSLTSIDLTIAGHSFSLAEIGFISPFGGGSTGRIIGGIVNVVNGLSINTWDFALLWAGSTPHLTGFNYTTEPNGGIYFASSFDEFSLTASPVPEPSTMLLLGSGLAGLVGYGRKRLKK